MCNNINLSNNVPFNNNYNYQPLLKFNQTIFKPIKHTQADGINNINILVGELGMV